MVLLKLQVAKKKLHGVGVEKKLWFKEEKAILLALEGGLPTELKG